jgi:acetyltransferase-like isoleucine patch superfamily enzyme/acyl carrier protein
VSDRSLAAHRALSGCNAVGTGIELVGAPFVQNLGTIVIGDRVHIKSEPVISHLVTGRRGRLEIGDGVRIAHGAAIAAHDDVRIGADVELGAFVMIMDTDFHEAGRHAESGGTGPIVIGAGARLGARVTVLRGTAIGAGAVVAAGSVVKGNVAAGARVAGVPARVDSGAANSAIAGEPLSIERVQAVVAHTFGLSRLPAASARRNEIAEWDSLGALNLLLSLEDAFGVALREGDLLAVGSVEDLLAVVAAADREAAA